MLIRTISGAFYVAILTAFFLLRQFVDYRLFHILTLFLLVMGTFEVSRAIKQLIISQVRVISLIFSIILVPAYCITEYIFLFKGWGFSIALDLIFIELIIICFIALKKGVSSGKFLWSCLPCVYPALLLLTMLFSNDMGAHAFIVLLLAFVISPISDTFAYLTGKLIGGKKLCPKLSPKKTWAGAIGGTIGGVIGAIAVYFIFMPKVNFFSPVLLFGLVGLLASVVNIFGDLFESFIKRKVGIKDMGKIMPGHGGVMDRIDGTSFVVAVIYLVFLFV